MEDEIFALGILLFNNSLIFSTKLIEEDFTSETRKKGFITLVKLVEAGEKVDCLYLSDKLKSQEPNKWYTTYGTGSLLESHERRIKEATKRRKLNKIFTYQNSQQPTDEIVSNIEKVLQNYDTTESTYTHVSDSIPEVVDYIEELHKLKGGCSGIPTGLDPIDYNMGGLQSEYMIIGARPSVGKTALIMTIIDKIALDKKVGVFSLEMPKKTLLTRLVSMKANIGMSDIRKGTMKEADFGKLANGFNSIEKMGLFIDDTPRIKLSTLKANARRMVKKDKVECIFIDYMTLIKPDKVDIPRHEQVSQISAELQGLQRGLKVSLIVLAQLTRDKDGNRPSLSSLRESGSIEQDADSVLFLHRDKKYDEHYRATNNIIPIDLIIAKNRNGAVCSDTLEFAQKQTRFQNPTGVNYD